MNQKTLRQFFSLISGELFYVEEDEVKNLDNYFLPLKKEPNKSCKKCYGRFHIGRDIKANYYIPCPRCMRTCLDFDRLKDDIVIESPKSTTELGDAKFADAISKALESKNL